MVTPLYIFTDYEGAVSVTDDDPQCPEIAGVEYGEPLRCSRLIHSDDSHHL